MPKFENIRNLAHVVRERRAAASAAADAALDKPRRFPGLHLPLLLVLAALTVYGLVVVSSAIQGNDEYSFARQLGGVAVGAIALAVVWQIDYRRLSDYVVPFLIINVVLIMSPHIPGLGTDAGMGARSWIRLGMQIQPGEFAKITVILMDAAVVARYGGRLDDVRSYAKALGIMLIPFVCIMTQPDLGTGLVYLVIAAVALVVGGARVRYLVATLAVGIALVAAVFIADELLKTPASDGSGYEYKLLKNYQRDRLLVFLNPDADTSGSGYNLRQAQIAIGSGGFLGKGLYQGTQHALGILPEAPTDFIFCVLAEELGFLGALALLALYVALVLVSFRIARNARDLFGMVIVMCVVGMWLFQILENIGMDCGLMPITGIPLPFMSYGSSFMVVNFVMVGLIGSVWAHSNRVMKQKTRSRRR